MLKWLKSLFFLGALIISGCASLAPQPNPGGSTTENYHATGTFINLGTFFVGQTSSHLYGRDPLEIAKFFEFANGGAQHWRWSFKAITPGSGYPKSFLNSAPNYWTNVWANVDSTLTRILPYHPGLNLTIRWVPARRSYEFVDRHVMWGPGQIDLTIAFHAPSIETSASPKLENLLRTVIHEYLHLVNKFTDQSHDEFNSEARAYAAEICTDYYIDNSVDHFIFSDIPEFSTYQDLLANPSFHNIYREFSKAPLTYRAGLIIQFNIINLVGKPIFSKEAPNTESFERFCYQVLFSGHDFSSGYYMP